MTAGLNNKTFHKYINSNSLCIFLLIIIILEFVFITTPDGKSVSSISIFQRPFRIAIVTAVHKNGESGYSYALDTIKCYCKIQGYEFILLENELNSKCNHSDHFFRRHCHVAHALANSKNDYFLFIDADIGVVNPKKRIEEYIDPKFDIEFYDRFFNQEIMMGSYIVKNSDWSINFLRNFANYQYRMPATKGVHGTDNGAIHPYVAEVLYKSTRPIEFENCMKIYNNSLTWNDVFVYETCFRDMLGVNTDFNRIKIFKKGQGWARDGWLTNHLWNSSRDFMIHAWKNKQLAKYGKDLPLKISFKKTLRWFNPLAGPINLAQCNPQNSTWNYDPNLFTTKEEIDAELEKMYASIAMDKINILSQIRLFFQKITSNTHRTKKMMPDSIKIN